MSQPSTVPPLPDPSGGPVLLVIDGAEQRTIPLHKVPFSIGRKPGNDLVLPDPRVSREHALITVEGDEYWLVDEGSKHGTFVNGQKVGRYRLRPNDRIELGTREGLHLIFGPEHPATPTSEELLTHIGELGSASDLEKLTLLLEAARKLNTTRVLDDVLLTLLDLTLRLTRAERAYVFLRERDGRLRMAAGRDAKGKPLGDDSTISRSIINEAAASGCEFLITDTSRYDNLAGRNSIVAFDLRTVICIPLCKARVTDQAQDENARPAVRGVLYLDSHFVSRETSAVSHDVLRAIATEAAALVENAYLVQAEEAARLYQKELTIAASIQQNLMPVVMPEVSFAVLRGRSVPCREIGGDFYDAITTRGGVALVVADVSGKGVSAALLASTLQGMIYSQVNTSTPLADIAAGLNDFLGKKHLETRYATLVLALLSPNGDLEIVNCGHVPPLVISGGETRWLEASNLPVGMLPEVTYTSVHARLQPGDRLVVYSDGVTEAANAAEEMFGGERLCAAAQHESPLDTIFAEVGRFCGGVRVSDDCTVLEVSYRGPSNSDPMPAAQGLQPLS
jgi:serine phosphatase RsbU (regulator of sigma subunit)